MATTSCGIDVSELVRRTTSSVMPGSSQGRGVRGGLRSGIHSISGKAAHDSRGANPVAELEVHPDDRTG